MHSIGLKPSRLQRACSTVLLLLSGAVCAGEPVPTVIVDIHAIGARSLAALKAEPSVQWSAEFGNELLLGVEPKHWPQWLKRDRVRDGLGLMADDEIWVRDHVCTHETKLVAAGVVGGYEIVRQPASLVRYAQRSGMFGTSLPADGVVAREQRNKADQKAAAKAVTSVASIVDRVDAERWFQTVETLSAFNRNSFSPTLDSARDWVLARFTESALETSIFPFTMPAIGSCNPTSAPIDLTNPIGLKRGETLPDEWIIVGAHYDSRNINRCDGTSAPQPGANDNASGCAGVIELARVYQAVATERSILFMCFSGEEQGLWGSRRYVEGLQGSGELSKVVHMLNMDMLGYDAGGPLDARVETTATHSGLLADYSAAAATYAPELNIITSSSVSAGSDHWYFLQAGVPAVVTWENGASVYPHYHRATDLPENMTRGRELAGGILKMDAAMLAQLAGLTTLFGDGFE